MLERLVAWFCNNYLGRYLENLNTDQLSVALLQGEVELENVPLKRDILNQLGLPLQIHAGFVGKICFQIPLRKIRSEPWVISFEQLYLVAGPKDKTEPYNEESEESAALERKMAALDLMEAEWRSENDPQGLSSSSLYSLTYSSWLSYGASLVTNIVQNIQLKIKDIHIRYEDAISCPGKVFACGIRVDSLTAQTCDESWIPKFMFATTQGIMYKLLELDGLAVYWDTNTELYADLPLDVLSSKLMQPCSVERNEFLLAPVSGYAHLKRNCSAKPLRSLNQPRIACDFQLDRVNVEIRDVQYHQLVQCCRSLEMLSRGLQYRRWRVDSEVEFHPRRQWRFAGQCVIAEIRKRNHSRNWAFALNRAKEIILYVRSFKDHLLNPIGVTAESKLHRERIESELDLEELQVLRSIAMQQISKSQSKSDSVLSDASTAAANSSLFHRWFSSWWTVDDETNGNSQSTNEDRVEHEILETLEDAMRDNTVRQRDILPLQLSSTLKQGLVRLSTCHRTETGQSWSTLLEIEFDNVVQEWESRPRLKSHKFHLSLGNVWVRDCATKGTCFPDIVCPQRKDARTFKSTTGMGALLPAFNIPFFRNSPSSPNMTQLPQDEAPLFDFVYEKRPPGSDWNHRLKITSLALECVYNHHLFQKIFELFSVPHKDSDERSLLGQRLRQAARSGFEAVKQKTKERLTQTLAPPTVSLPSDQSWDLLINISAPHILIPESVVSRDSLLLIVDFGHFHVTRTDVNCIAAELASTTTNGNEDDEEEEYVTPCSTPPNETAVTTPVDEAIDTSSFMSSSKDCDDSSDKYNVHFSDLQLLVCRVKDNWKQAHLKGTSALHLLDRFSILIHVEKYGRILPGLEKPFLTLTASLPHLVAHINEPKIHALVSVSKQFRSSSQPPPVYETTSEDDETGECELDESSAGLEKSDEHWFMAQFNIEQLSVEVQSRGRSVAELQVGGVLASYSMRPMDSSIHLAVHSLLLVDAMQTLGSDYELLIASHKHVSMDSMSGSLKESEPTSPVSPSSPDPSSLKGQRATSPVSLAQALTSLQTDPSWRKDGLSPPAVRRRMVTSALKSEALILIDIVTIEPTVIDGKPEGRIQIIKVHFNSLDVIANQDTVVELVSFFQRIVPKKRVPPSPDDSNMSTDQPSINQSRFPPFTLVPDVSTEITFDFHRLTVLLLRSTVKDEMLVGRKVATLTVTDARINANLSSDVIVQGSLGGLQVLDLTPEGQKHQRVISVGHDVLVEQQQNLYMLVSQGLYETAKDKNEVKAFSFKFLQPGLEISNEEGPNLSLEVRMASLCYSHSVHFLAEVTACVSEFKQSVSNMAMSLKLTAAEMAVDLLHRGTEGLAQSIYMSGSNSMTEGLSLHAMKEATDEEQQSSFPSRVRFSALLESPILVLPRSAKSPQVLVAHLGQIEITNDKEVKSEIPSHLSEELSGGTHKEHFEVEVRDMSLYSLNVDEKWKTSFSHFYSGPSSFLRVTAQELYSCASPHGRPILHDTLLRFSLHRITDRPIQSDADPFLFHLSDFYPKPEVCDVFQVHGCVVSPLQVSLSKAQYQQIIQSLDNLNWSKVDATNNFEAGPDFPAKNRPSPRVKQRELVLNFKFQLPRFSMELLNNSDRAIVNLSFEDFLVAYEQNCSYSATVQTSLKSLILEDLMMKEDSKYRRLVASNDQKSERIAGRPNLSSFMSSSCPDLRAQGLYATGARSLPARLELDQSQWKQNRVKPPQKKPVKKCPSTPPSSPSMMYHQRFSRSGVGDNNLVFIKILLVDPDSPDFALKYNSTHRFIEINFNALDMIVNLESWVMVLDFFGTAKTAQQQKKKVAVSSPGYQDWSKAANANTMNSRWEVEVRSFNLLLNRKDYEVAEATISNLSWEMASMRGNLDVTGKLGSITVQDLTSAGRMYRERFITSGNEALDFQFFCFSADDPHLARDYDIRLNLNMASVLYVHTQRFYTECFSLLEQFQQLRQVAASLSTTGQNSTTNVSQKPWSHGTRILLNVEAGSPVILVPVCSTSEHLLVIDLGRISVCNTFMMSNGSVSTPTVSKSRKPNVKGLPIVPVTNDPEAVLVDVIQVELSNMDLCTGQRQKANRSQVGDLILGSYLIRRSGQSLLKEKCEMKVKIRRNLDSHLGRPVPDMDLCGLLSRVECSIDEHQYKLVRGLLGFNLGEPMDLFSSDQRPPPSPMQTLADDSKPPIWAKLKLQIDLENVILEVKDLRTGPFSTIKFIKSRLVYESNSDGSKDVDLVSQQVVVRDTRYDSASATQPIAKRNVFTQILEPVTKARREGSLQAEVHYRSTEEFTRFTVVLNNMRLLAVFDWWALFQEFLLQNPEEYRGTTIKDKRNSEKNDVLQTPPPWISTSKPSPIVVSTGVISKRAALVETQRLPVEFKINISDSEVVIIEDTSISDSSAVILKGTALLTYRPQIQSKPLSCQLNRVEIFSSQLNLEEETALSIVDPATISIEIVGKSSATDVKGIMDATNSELQQILEIQAQQVILRLSYNDMKLFLRILDSLPRQARSTSNPDSTIVNEVKKLKALGFSTEDCHLALRTCSDNLEEAALWLTQNASATVGQQQMEMTNEIKIRCIEVRTGCISLCVIDDCRDADLPLVEFTTSQLHLRQSIDTVQMTGEGSINCQFAIDYYNRVLSGWEPFVEPFKCHVRWNFLPFYKSIADRQRPSLFFDTEDVVNITCTRALLELVGTVKMNWMEDYYGQNGKEISSQLDGGNVVRQRSPFVPFALHNATGSKLKFRTLTASLLADATPSKASSKDTRWINCDAGDVVAFSFENRGKLRHHDSHEMQTHQLAIELDGWMELGSVSVDRVGVYFRYAQIHNSPNKRNAAAFERELERVLVVIAVTLEGSARRLVTIRSALQVTNNLEETVELRLEPPAFNLHPGKTVRVPPCTTYPIPMAYLMSQIFVRPMAEKLPHIFSFCKDPIEWHANPSQSTANIRQCNPVISNQDLTYRFAVNIHRENFPPDKITPDGSEFTIQPAHTVSLLSPLAVVNLLPYELLWELKAVGQSGIIKPGKSTSIHTVNVSAGFQIAFRTENFVHSSDLVIGTSPHNFNTRLRLYDSANRLLFLQVKVSSKAAGSVKLSISAPYWLVNKAGIPLIFRQEGVQQDAAGQFDEHEMARSLSPMLFSFTDREASNALTARIGTGLHIGCKPHWSQPFALQKGVRVRSFMVSPRDGRPELVYLVGISIRSGRGRYRDTQIVTLAPCYQLYNQSSWMLEVSQAYFASTFTDPGAQSTYLNLVPGCHLPFHWPRLDKDQLLCIRLLDLKNCHWSGGFAIRNISSFHINIRDSESRANFLRVEIFQQECTYCVVFSDATGFPPPLRIDNLAQVPIIFHQTDVPEAYLHTTVRPNSSMPYVFDEPTKPAQLSIVAPGGASASYDMTTLKEGCQLTYENFIYVCLTVTFNGDDMSTGNALDPNNVELVLDVPEGTRVVLGGKETGKRSQLWRMTGSGMLQHEGSSPPRDPSNPQIDPSRILVLDIAGPALQPSEYVHLMLRKPDARRQLTQTWRFTDDGRLCCGHSNVFVQAKDGFYGVRQGNDVVLGPAQSVTYYRLPSGIPAEQAIHWQRLRPGSGCLSVKTIMDGPTRVLQIADLKSSHHPTNEGSVATTPADKPNNKETKMEMNFKGGLGFSIVNHSPPEELAYCRLSNISLELITGNGMLSVDASVQSIQIDNSLQDPHCPVVIYVSSTATQEESKNIPALRLTVHRQMTGRLNADIFKHLIVTFKNLTINIEENQLFKLLAFAGFNQSDLELERVDESDYESQRSLNAATSIDAKRYYFGALKLVLEQVRLSVYTSSKLPPELNAIKRKLGLTLIKFEEANIELHPFIRSHPFETAQLIIDSVVKHYKDELKSQAARILGSTDFLGNPLGFVNDVSEGFSGFLNEGNVGALVQNVTFGLSNSAAKVTGSLSDGLGRVTMDERHEEVRQRLLKHTGQSSDHLVAGLKGFGFGILGGMTSIFTQTYEGVSNDGFGGLFTGFGKGLVGTVTKPAVGVLDLATGAASAVRDSSRSSSKEIPKRIRPPRLVIGPGGILPRYSEKQGRGQELLFQLNRDLYQETFIAYEALGNLPDSLHILISSENVRVFSMNSPNKEVVLDIHLSELQSSKAVVIKDYGTQNTAHYYVEMNLLLEPESPLGARRPQVRCDSESLAKRVTQEINYAKSVYEENRHSLVSSSKFSP